MMPPFDGRVVMITGAGRGIGRAAALAFARAGAAVAVNDVTPINLDQTVMEVRNLGGEVKDYVADVGKQMPVEGMLSRVLEDFGRIDALVNAASVHPHRTLFALDEWDWHRTLDVNLGGPFYTMQIAARAMQRQGGGAIVNFGMVVLPLHENPAAAFAAAQMGVIGLTQAAAREWGADGIRVNVVCPTSEVPTGLPGVIRGEDLFPATRAAGQVQAAEIVVRLCSQAAGDVSGRVVLVDGWE